jgi:heat shock protein HtpX
MPVSESSANILEQQATNRRNTVLVMVLFILFVGFLGFGFDVFLLGFSPGGSRSLFGFPVATCAALLIGGFSAWRGLEGGASAVLGSSGAVPASADDPRYKQLHNVVEEMAIAAGLPKPQVYVIPDPDPNAFATGKDPEHACIAVTQGLLDSLNRDELQGVVAHELGHVRNYDIRVLTVIAALIGAVMLLVEFGSRTMAWGGGGRRRSSDRSGGGGGIILLVFWVIGIILAPFIAQLLAMAVSRQREFLADASGAELTRNPAALASALQKIDAAVEPTRSIKKGTAHLCIANPLGSSLDDKEGFFANLFSTHPPIQKRIMLLKAMAYQHA